jgi:hypothetical protein
MTSCAAQPRIKTIVWDYNVTDERVLQAVSAGGWRNFAYGAVTAAEHQRCSALGLTGLITDYPRLVAGSRA